MPFRSEKQRYHDKKFIKCKYCDNEVKRNITTNGRNKGLYRTCGSVACLTEQYRSEEVKLKKNYKTKNEKRKCAHCGKSFLAETHTHKWCRKCVPDRVARAMMQRYNLNAEEAKELFEKNKGMCYICDIRKATVIDHNHETGEVRGALCQACNGSLWLLEDEIIYKNAMSYLGII